MLFLLVFFQQTGGGLFIHNFFHDKANVNHAPVKQNETTKEFNFACSCVDNFLMPYVSEDDFPPLPKSLSHSTPIDFYIEQPHFTALILTALRGPPAFIA
ncbi:MAG: hypothetical protein ACXWV1_13005 [Chitinophagaceae bacterium]